MWLSKHRSIQTGCRKDNGTLSELNRVLVKEKNIAKDFTKIKRRNRPANFFHHPIPGTSFYNPPPLSLWKYHSTGHASVFFSGEKYDQ
jgi:hypothetical protein